MLRPIQPHDTESPRALYSYLRELELDRDRLRRDLASLKTVRQPIGNAPSPTTLAKTSTIITNLTQDVTDYSKVRDAIKVGGKYELPVDGLHGLLGQPQVPLIPRVSTLPPVNSTLYTVVFKIGSGTTPDQLYVLDKTGNPYVWRQIATTPSNMMTTDTAQNVTATKTFTVAQIMNSTFSKYNNDTTAGNGVPGIVYRQVFLNQVAAIGLRAIFTPPVAGEYRLSYYMVTTTAGVGNVQFLYGYTDVVGARASPLTLGAMALVANAIQYNSLVFNSVAAVNIQIDTVYAATGTYAIYVFLERLS